MLLHFQQYRLAVQSAVQLVIRVPNTSLLESAFSINPMVLLIFTTSVVTYSKIETIKSVSIARNLHYQKIDRKSDHFLLDRSKH